MLDPELETKVRELDRARADHASAIEAHAQRLAAIEAKLGIEREPHPAAPEPEPFPIDEGGRG